MDFSNLRKKEDLILKILQLEKGEIYLSNEGSKNYVSESFFEKQNIKVIYKNTKKSCWT